MVDVTSPAISGPATGDYLEKQSRDNTVRVQKIKKAWQAYKGKLPDSITVRANRPNDNVKTNHCKIVINTGVSYLFGDPFEIILDEESEELTDEERYIENVFRFNRGDVLFQRLAVNGFIAGHAFLKIILREPYPKLVVVDPINVDVVTSPDDFTEVMRYKITWVGNHKGKKAVFRQVIERSDLSPSAPEAVIFMAQIQREQPRNVITGDDEAVHWRIIDQVTYEGATGFIENKNTAWETLAVDIWPYEFSPMLDCQNLPVPNEFWGESDLEEDVIAMQMAMNRSLTNINKILRLHAHPKTYATGLSEMQLKQLVTNPEGILGLPNPESALHNLEMTSDLTSSINYFVRLRETFHERTSIPEIVTGKMESIGQLAGVAMQILYTPLLQKTSTKRTTYGHLIEELVQRLLFIEYADEPDPTEMVNILQLFELWDVKINWPEILPSDPEQEARTMLLDAQLGVSNHTLMTKRGYDPDAEKKQKELETADALKQAQGAMDALNRGQVAGVDPFGRDKNAGNSADANEDEE